MNNLNFYTHFFELKKNIYIYFFFFFFNFIICYIFSDQILFILIKKLINLNLLKYFIFTDLTEIFIIKIINSLIFTYIYTIPFFIIQFWIFLSKGLYKSENYNIINIYIYYICIYIINFLLLIYFLIPNTFLFFFNYEKIHNEFIFNIFLEPKLYTFLIFLFKILVYLNIFFQLQLILYIIIKYKYIKYKILIKFRKFFYFIFILISTIIAPPDIFTQIILFIPLLIIFEFYLFKLYLNKTYLFKFIKKFI